MTCVRQAQRTAHALEAVNANSEQPGVTPASASVRRGSSSTAAAASSAADGLRAPHATRRSVTSDGRMSSFACATQRVVKSSTVTCRYTSFTAAYRAPATSMRLTHTVTAASADACGSEHA
jgi:hypothetical protein